MLSAGEGCGGDVIYGCGEDGNVSVTFCVKVFSRGGQRPHSEVSH